MELLSFSICSASISTDELNRMIFCFSMHSGILEKERSLMPAFTLRSDRWPSM